MSSEDSFRKTENKPRKKRKTKRPASSPLNDNDQSGVNSIGERSVKPKSKSKSNKFNNGATNNSAFVTNQGQRSSNCYSNASNIGSFVFTPNMSFPQQSFGGFSFGSQGGYPTPSGSPTMPPPMQPMPPMQPPDWAAQLISDVKAIKTQVSKIEDVQKTVNQICVRIQDLETNVTSIDSRLSMVENSCSFIGKQYDDHKKELTDTKSKLNSLKGTCTKLENKTKSLEADKSNLEAKLVDLEYRSTRDNLMFYGVPEQNGEDCEDAIKNIMSEHLDVPRAGILTQQTFDVSWTSDRRQTPTS